MTGAKGGPPPGASPSPVGRGDRGEVSAVQVRDLTRTFPNIVRGEPPTAPSKIVEVRIGTKAK